jgi:hypothetical protein
MFCFVLLAIYHVTRQVVITINLLSSVNEKLKYWKVPLLMNNVYCPHGLYPCGLFVGMLIVSTKTYPTGKHHPTGLVQLGVSWAHLTSWGIQFSYSGQPTLTPALTTAGVE